jgi:hypothetical protein
MGVTTCRSFVGLKTAPQTAESLKRGGFSTDLMLGAGGSRSVGYKRGRPVGVRVRIRVRVRVRERVKVKVRVKG